MEELLNKSFNTVISDIKQTWKDFSMSSEHIKVLSESVSLLKISGYLDSDTVEQLEESFHNEIVSGARFFVVDVSSLDYISSAGLGLILGLLSEAKEKGGELVIVGMTSKIARKFDLLGFSHLLSMLPDVQQGIDKLSQKIQTV